MAGYDSVIALAKRLITKKGQEVALRGFTTGTAPDPAKPWEPGANSVSDQTVSAVFLDYEQKYVDGTMIRTGDQIVYMPSTDVLDVAIAPQVDGLVLRGAEVWEIVNSRPLNPAGQPIMYVLQVRQ